MSQNIVGTTLEGRYHLDVLVGVGGMANVYKATDLKTNQTVAVKILKEECLDNEELVRRFRNESKAISILNHPNIVKVIDVASLGEQPYIVMEYIDGITLKEYLVQRNGPLTWKEVVHFITNVLSALEHAHSKGVVHRDVKPQNIMLLADGNIKIMDFGIARISRSQSYTMSDKAIGSVHYISPEQAKGDVTDAKADIYSVGIMMYEMLSGRLPFEANSAVSIAIMQISDEATPLSVVAPNVPEALQKITEKAMAKNPEDRYPSARAMLEDIEAFKQNPDARFEYQYIRENNPERFVHEVMKDQKEIQYRSVNVNGAAQGNRTGAQRAVSSRTTSGSRTAMNSHTAAGGNYAGTNSRAAAAANQLYGERTAASRQAASPSRSVQAANAARASAASAGAAKSSRKKKRRFDFLPVFVGMTAAFAICAFIMCYYIFASSTNPLFSTRKDIVLDDYVGMTTDEVKASASYSDVNIVYDEQYNSNCDAGIVYSQSPKAGRTAKEGQTVTLKVSLGTKWVTVPELKNVVSADAQDALREMGLTLRVKYIVNENFTVGTVIETDPVAGSTVASGTTVTLYVSQAKIDINRSVPSVVGLQLEEALSVLANNSLAANVVEEASGMEAGTVTAQSLEPGTDVKMNTRVTIYVSTGVPEVEVSGGLETGSGVVQFVDGDNYTVCPSCGHHDWYMAADGQYHCTNCGAAL